MRYRFNGISLHTGTRRIRGPDGFVHLPPKPFGVLLELLRRAGEVVTREELLDRVWPERPASDETLSRCVADLRKYLGDKASAPRYIETVPKVGYRFLGAPERGDRSLGYRDHFGRILLVGLVAVSAVGVLLWTLRNLEERSLSRTMLAPLVPVTTAVGDEDVPDFSPDGSHIVYAARNKGDENWEIRLQSLDTGAVRDLITGPDREYSPVFSPDGARIAYLRYRGEACTVLIRALQGNGDEHPVATCRTPLMAYLDWSPSGQYIAYSDSPHPGSQVILRLVDADTGAVTRLVTGDKSDLGHEFAPKFSPDGALVAFIRGTLDHNELWLLDSGTGHARPITRLGGRVTGLSWNAEGTALYFSTSTPEPALWRIVPGESPLLLRRGEVHTPAFDPVHGRLIYDQIHRRTNIWSVDLQAGKPAGEPHPRISSTRTDNMPSISPDGSRVAFVSDRTGAPEVWSADADGGEERRLTRWEAAAIDRPGWSPDSRFLVYSVLSAGMWTGYLHPMNGLPPEPLSLADREIRHPIWTSDGTSILYAGDSGIRRVFPLDWRDEPVLQLKGAIPLFEKERTIYILSPDHPGIVMVEGGTGTAKVLLADFDLQVPSSISFAHDRLYFIATSPLDGVRRLFSHDLTSNRLISTFSLVAFGRQAHVSAATNAELLVFSQTVDVDSDLVLIENPP